MTNPPDLKLNPEKFSNPRFRDTFSGDQNFFCEKIGFG